MGKRTIYCFIACLLIAQTQAWGWGSDDDEPATKTEERDDEYVITEVTCGSVIKLRHVATNIRLHSHQVTYGSGSGQQSVTGFPNADDPNSLWLVAGPVDKHCPTGTVVKNGDIIRLQHINTGKNLHSHLHRSPLSNQQEVSAFGESGKGDTGDNWKVVTSDKTWKRANVVSFQHVDTGRWLSSNKNKFGHPIPGQQEVCAISSQSKEVEWVSEEGFYFPSNSSDE